MHVRLFLGLPGKKKGVVGLGLQNAARKGLPALQNKNNLPGPLDGLALPALLAEPCAVHEVAQIARQVQVVFSFYQAKRLTTPL